ncbi:MAG: hypothetical protein ACYS32_00465 [Planctomycetota bacterium]|jgi:hypothetical protein
MKHEPKDPDFVQAGKREEERNEAMNLMNSAHKSTNKAYRDGWVRVFGKKKKSLPDLEWYGYLQTNGTVHLKRYRPELQRGDIDEAIESDFVAKVYGPFAAKTREEAFKILREGLK